LCFFLKQNGKNVNKFAMQFCCFASKHKQYLLCGFSFFLSLCFFFFVNSFKAYTFAFLQGFITVFFYIYFSLILKLSICAENLVNLIMYCVERGKKIKIPLSQPLASIFSLSLSLFIYTKAFAVKNSGN
jgi:hypothetical protein